MSVISAARFYDGAVVREGLKLMPESSGKAGVSATGSAESGAKNSTLDPDLQAIINAWAALPEADILAKE